MRASCSRRDKEAVLDRGDAAVDRIVDARRAGRMGKGLSTEFCRSSDNRGDLVGRHLRSRGDAPGAEIDDAAHEQLDAIGSLADAGRDASGGTGMVFDRLAHERAVSATVMQGRAGAINPGRR